MKKQSSKIKRKYRKSLRINNGQKTRINPENRLGHQMTALHWLGSGAFLRIPVYLYGLSKNISLLFGTWGTHNYFIIFVCFFKKRCWSVKGVNETADEKPEKQGGKKPFRLKLTNLLDKKCSTQNYLVRIISEAKSANAITTAAATWEK